MTTDPTMEQIRMAAMDSFRAGARTLVAYRLGIRARGIRANDEVLDRTIRDLRNRGILPGRVFVVNAHKPKHDPGRDLIDLPWHRRLYREHMARERRIRAIPVPMAVPIREEVA